MRVLLADDEQLLADTVADGLRKLAMAVDVCYDGDAAQERLAVQPLRRRRARPRHAPAHRRRGLPLGRRARTSAPAS